MSMCWVVLLIFIIFMIYTIVKDLRESDKKAEYRRAQEERMKKQTTQQVANLPNEDKLLSMNGDETIERLQEMHSLGAKIIFLAPVYSRYYSTSTYNKTILTDQALCFKNFDNRFFVTPPSVHAEIRFDIEEKKKTYTTTKNKSPVGRAVVGGALAGGVGAVVGAASALSGGGTKTVSHTYSDYYLRIKLSDVTYIEPKVIYVSNELIDKLGELFADGQRGKGPYTVYEINSIMTWQKDIIANRIIEYMEKAITTKLNTNE